MEFGSGIVWMDFTVDATINLMKTVDLLVVAVYLTQWILQELEHIIVERKIQQMCMNVNVKEKSGHQFQHHVNLFQEFF